MDWQRGLGALFLMVAFTACDRNGAPFDPDEEPSAPDLSRIFPEGAKPRGPAQLPEASGPSRDGGAAAEVGEAIRGRVSVSEELAPRVPRGAVLFIIARRGDAGPPLAVKRVRDPALPLEFSLGPGDRMIQALPFQGPLKLSARLDADGNAMSREPGDLLGEASEPVETGSQGVEIVIDRSL